MKKVKKKNKMKKIEEKESIKITFTTTVLACGVRFQTSNKNFALG